MPKRKRRKFTPEFKAEVVLEALSGETTQAELCQRHNISEGQLSKMNTTHLQISP
ncbi:transposase [Candidatus Poribacteria bacterium]|nr:transposase [Candidatus Poribacteria bacterium]MYK24309.1 transposase [Candidatus Poribacteria bacterium]